VRELGPHRSGGGANRRPFDPHEECQRLCALSLSGDLSEDQAQWLDTHLRACTECKRIFQEYEELVDSVMPELAEQDLEFRIEEPSSTWSIEDAERRLFAALPTRSSTVSAEHPATSSSSLWVKFGRYGIAAGLLIAILALGYELGHRSAPTLALQKPMGISPTPSLPGNISKIEKKELPESQNVESLDREVASLREQVHSLTSDISRLQEQRSLLEDKLAAQSQTLQSSAHSQDDLKAQLSKADSDNQSLEAQLASAEADRSKESADASQLRAQLKELTETLQSQESDIAQDQELLKHDRDIRNLITARDLYIAEIYDVAKSGNTEKPFGRIFYTKGKSLIFYGYDLDQQPGLRNAATFQAWGRRGADDQHDVSLGILYKDDASQKRWVLKFNDSATLAQIDEVFVTVEPRGGSKKPSGKPLLFASLHIDPNHP
jgi:anti-sigma-K factor RskA